MLGRIRPGVVRSYMWETDQTVAPVMGPGVVGEAYWRLMVRNALVTPDDRAGVLLPWLAPDRNPSLPEFDFGSLYPGQSSDPVAATESGNSAAMVGEN